MVPTNLSTHTSSVPSSATPAEASSTLSSDDVFHLLQTFRRRETIRYLLCKDGPVRMGDVAEHVAAQEHDTTVADLTSAQRQRVYIPLYQSHLPKLDKAGIIDYDKPRGIVRPTDDLQLFRPYLEAATNHSPETDVDHFGTETRNAQRYYLTALAASLGFLVASALGALELPGLTLGAIITSLFVLATVLDRAVAVRDVASRLHRR
ncbi:DUF7344 domain-containing protein [Natronorubrum halophilum]|uniref:DUF7344 domain-containing protein n=1 Tax=Natronorubrum halophilum TaxID=1702106 RepID=UPI0010C1BEA4|nr:hypothetical protein [Natronorubrum halophilum]